MQSTTNDTPLRVAICAIAKNEGKYLAEWVAFHHLTGFGPIRVYSHESTDDSDRVLTQLAARDLVEWEPWSAPPDKKPQWLAYEDGLAQLRGRAEWIAFIDIDEFLVTPQHASIQAFLHDHQDLEALAVNWKMFGSSGLRTHEPGLVIERFTQCAPRQYRGNRAVKTLARLDAIDVPRVHTCQFRRGVRYRTITGEEIAAGAGTSSDVSHDAIRVNHYFTRSLEEWQAKARRGRGAKPANHPLKHRQIHEFHANDRNDERDLEMLRFVPGIQALLTGIVDP